MENGVPHLTDASRSAASEALERRRIAYAEEVHRLVAASFALIRDQGTLEPRVSEIVKAAGLSNQAFYRHFHSKDELLLAVLADGVRQLHGYLAHRMDGAAEPLEKVRCFLAGVCEQVLDPAAARATRPFALSRGRLMDLFPDQVARAEADLTALLRGAIEAAARSGDLHGTEPELDARTLYDFAVGWLGQRIAQPGRASRAEADHVVAFALRGLRRP
jgi:AcrR family transcriptional regulator